MSEEPKSPFADREPDRQWLFNLWDQNLSERERPGARQAIQVYDRPRAMLRRLDTKFAKIVEDFTGQRGLAEPFWDRLSSRPEWTPGELADLECVIRRFDELNATLGAEASRCWMLAAEMKR